MGSGYWSGDVYDRVTSATAFAYDASVRATGRLKVHPALDPLGLRVRESRDSDEHPESVPIAVFLDVTGSNIQQAKIVHAELPRLNGLLQRKGYVAHPQILFGGIGDALAGDRVPFQIGQFESDNRMDEQLGNMVLEGGGGGGLQESYELALYAMACRMDTDAFSRRGKQGYAFIIGDEMAYPVVRADVVKGVFGGQTELRRDIPLEEAVREAERRFEVYVIIPSGAFHGRDPRIEEFWRNLIGQRVLRIDDASQICEMIAAQIGASEGLSFNTLLEDLRESGASTRTLATVRTALARREPRTSVGSVVGGLLGLTSSASSRVVRL